MTAGPAEATWAAGSDLAAGPDGRPADDHAGDDRTAPITAQIRLPSMKPEPLKSPMPWPIQTAPTTMRIPAMIQRMRIGTSSLAS